MTSERSDAVSLAFEYADREKETVLRRQTFKMDASMRSLWDQPGLVDYKTARYRSQHRDLFLEIQEKRGAAATSLVDPTPALLRRNPGTRLMNMAIPDFLEPGEKPNPVLGALGSARSRLLHPLGGLGGGGGSAARRIARRCPAGFENGGRFADRTFTNCGQRLFDIFDGPGGASVLPNIAQAVGGAYRAGGPARAVRIGRVIGEGRYLNEPAIQRRPQIPDLGVPDLRQQDSNVKTLVKRLGGKEGKETSLFVRKDGVVTVPKAPFSKLAYQRSNKEIEDGVVVMRAANVNAFAGDEVTMIGSGTRSVVYALPGNRGQISLSRKGKMTSAQAGVMRRRLGLMRRSGQASGPEILRSLADGNDALTYSEIFEGVDNPGSLVRVALNGNKQTTKLTPRWMYEIYLSASAPGNDGKAAWTIVDSDPT